MAQDPNQQSQYSSGYSGYSGSTSRPGDEYGHQPYGQTGYQAGGQPGSQQTGSGQQQQQQFAYGQQQQQYGTYQPPLSATRGGGAHDPTSTGWSARTEALASYALGWITGLIFFVIERKNRFVRFNAAQSVMFFGSVSVFYALVRLIGYLISIIPFLGGLLGFVLNPVLACITFVVLIPAGLIWIFLMIQSYRGVTVRLPFFSNYAESLVNRFSKKQATI